MTNFNRPISWIKAARKGFEKFPHGAQMRIFAALDVAASGQKADIAKPMRGFGSGVFEIALKYKSDAYRIIYVLKLNEKIWVLHAFQKKAKTGIKTPTQDIEKIKTRIKAIKENLENDKK